MGKEKVVVLDEVEACVVYAALVEQLKMPCNLLDEEEWENAVFLKALVEKLRKYLDEGIGKDVIERD